MRLKLTTRKLKKTELKSKRLTGQGLRWHSSVQKRRGRTAEATETGTWPLAGTRRNKTQAFTQLRLPSNRGEEGSARRLNGTKIIALHPQRSRRRTGPGNNQPSPSASLRSPQRWAKSSSRSGGSSAACLSARRRPPQRFPNRAESARTHGPTRKQQQGVGLGLIWLYLRMKKTNNLWLSLSRSWLFFLSSNNNNKKKFHVTEIDFD